MTGLGLVRTNQGAVIAFKPETVLEIVAPDGDRLTLIDVKDPLPICPDPNAKECTLSIKDDVKSLRPPRCCVNAADPAADNESFALVG